MEENVTSMFMDVKLDIRERKLEFSHLKNWTRYFVRVEAVKCFPCYMKISFFKSHIDESTDLIVRINIPGLTVQMATSRTRAHLYGLFWKNNRKRCCAYFALPSQLLCERHLQWMRKSIRNLELYRQEILQLRRASRTPMHEIKQEMQPDPANNDLGIYQNLDITQNTVSVNGILGPLPNVPESVVNLSQRMSGVSGIYEEIFDPNNPRTSRVSVASGIYEEMRPINNRKYAEEVALRDLAPPLPPRPRSNTNEFELQRSFTTPESDYLKKKKHWLLFESVFGRRRAHSGSTTLNVADSKSPRKDCLLAKATKTSPHTQKVIYREKRSHRLAENKRNSFSSPDLSILKMDGDKISDDGSCSSEFYVNHRIGSIENHCISSEMLNVSQCSSIEESLSNLLITGDDCDTKLQQVMNVSENIVPNFNSSCNTSTVNLVGINCEITYREPITAESIPVGYCIMGPPGTGFNREEINGSEKNNNEESLYMNMENKTPNQKDNRSSSSSSGVSSIYSNRTSVCSSGKQRNSIDDKVPSYYPNEDFRTPKKSETSPSSRKSPSASSRPPSNDKLVESNSVTPPVHRIRNISTMPRLSKSAQKPHYKKSRINGRSSSSERCDTSATPKLIVNDASPTKNIENSPPAITPKIHQKYATIARTASPSSKRTHEKNSAKKNTDQMTVSYSKRFGSLPRFGKFDLSPLRLKINSVLQRHNSENS
ncbi:uncharacterized protein LOC129775384 [Toxorhynchites rutilus septentrionalis]|uniref:uncharacterized protein LOC129775384 n=1 Tax=Toxorhynchites rutilus septentrionalis TaxID=329112 RepID=UPI00247AF5D7|nr:uncharacterized protein LOC129775384 [Toxorhynchites rutilus septentrionalis]XP_055636049.1 uncharacterized protein LOC129775384 [Toxorhynchites rutilus septentrionalis]